MIKPTIILLSLFIASCGDIARWRARYLADATKIEMKALGEAKLLEAESERKVQVLDAKAKLASASLFAKAEVARAKGVAAANKIIGNSLKGNESYLRYLWIQNLEKGKAEIIYVPTEANLPILEANRRKQWNSVPTQ